MADVTSNLRSLLEESQKCLDYYQDEDAFLKDYLHFMKDKPATLLLLVNSVQISLYQLYIEVISHGGFQHITSNRYWNRIWHGLSNPSPDPQALPDRPPPSPFTCETERRLRESYSNYLLDFEVMKRRKLVGDS
eukprot:TRINITY_DN18814_c0_g1_i2.p2 TRINITY_DN18814_c0_g1~~TRINITY_DN18814_c0_g1_i2.p2  ORF type:complete len:134 (-),score=29.38 TRINITY_DN18814_c0_g1_i2:538-939(-)